MKGPGVQVGNLLSSDTQTTHTSWPPLVERRRQDGIGREDGSRGAAIPAPRLRGTVAAPSTDWTIVRVAASTPTMTPVEFGLESNETLDKERRGERVEVRAKVVAEKLP